jgi:hypothetical protein
MPVIDEVTGIILSPSSLLSRKKNLVTLSTIYKHETLCYTACEEVGCS